MTFAATSAGDEHYVIDEIFVDGIALGDDSIQGSASYTWNAATHPGVAGDGLAGAHSVVAAFAYVITFEEAANGHVEVNGAEAASGAIVRGGDVVALVPDKGYEAEVSSAAGLTELADGAYAVTARQEEPTPALSFSFKQRAYTQTDAEGNVTLSVVGATRAGCTADVTEGGLEFSCPFEGYAVDAVFVDGAALELGDAQRSATYTWSAAGHPGIADDAMTGGHSVVVDFAPTITLAVEGEGAVTRGGEPLESGAVAHGGDVVALVPDTDEGYALGAVEASGLTQAADGTWVVTAEWGDAAPRCP